MAGIDPLAALTARVAAAQAAMADAAINLGATAEILQAQISVGDVLPAQILPPQNGQDSILIAGQQVTAQLPPGVYPGETLLLQVTGFAGTQIFVRNLGTPDPENPLAVNDAVIAPSENESPQSAILTTIRPAQPQQPPAVAPSRAVFVAASVRPAQPQAASAPPTPSAQVAAAVRGVEARIAAAQAAKPPAAPPIVRAPLIPPRAAAAEQPAAERQATENPAVNAVRRAVQTVSEFLRAARLPDTPFTRIAASIAPKAPERISSVLQRLEAALPRVSQDARIPTLRTLIGFTAKLNPANAETLRAQISSYVSNVVQGVEAKLAQLLAAHAEESVPLAQARAAERSAAVAHDLKSVVLSLLRDPPAERTPALSQALNETLITLTGTQVNALSSAQQNPGTIALTLPVFYYEGGKPAQIRISRDGESNAEKMDGDNFHVAFLLDTANLGTVAVDLQSSGRTVKLDVKTERPAAANRFSDTLSSLRARLEDLRYRVASAAASALPPPATRNDTQTIVINPISRPAKNDAPQSGLDLRA